MTRPGLVRADTIDLQNQDAPTTQDHHSTSLQPSDVGKHQASEIRHVREERHEEEEHLQDAWTRAHQDVRVNELTDDQLQAHNRENGDSTDDSELDDDMLDDRISSSPSIDDGAYPVATFAWPHRSSSLTPPRQTLNCEAIDSPDSSPFVLAPAHLPLSVMSPAGSAASPAASSQSSSPFILSPKHLPLSASPLSGRHHHTGEYAGRYLEDYDQHTDDYHKHDLYREPNETRDEYPDDDLSHTGFDENLTAIPKENDRDELDTNGLFSYERGPTSSQTLLSRTASPSSWSTVSDASASSVLEDLEPQNKHDNDDDLDLFLYSDDRFVDSGWGGECLRETEDIDFDFVYALHTFVATVEGQANAGKGDTMVLLDDSNSYWWLVRIVKDNSIGYLPAEHIETPTERLARLNKHRNVDLSAAMLGDTAENSKNPLKKAMKRRKAKTVQFTAPTFVEASDYDYSSDEEDGLMPEPLYGNENQSQQEDIKSGQEKSLSGTDIATTVVEVERVETPDLTSPGKDIKAPAEEPLSSPTLVDKTEAAPLKSSRKGTPRNADSFLKDDGAEPLKISLTPNLLRDNSNGSRSLESTGSSMEGLEKTASPPDKSKDDKKKKEKKPGMLSGLFKSKKKDKRNKNSVDEDSDIEKLSSELARQSTSSDSNKGSPIERPAQFVAAEPKSRGKLQKSQVGGPAVAPLASQAIAPAPVSAPAPALAPIAAPDPLQLPSVASATQRQRDEQPSSSFVAELEGSTVDTPSQPVQRNVELRQQEPRAANETLLGSHTLSSITNKMRHSESQESIKPKKVKKAKARVELDDFDEISDEETQAKEIEEGPSDAFMHGTEMVHIPINLGDESSSPDDQDTNEERGGEESSERTSSPSMIGTPKASLDGSHENEKHTRDVPVSNVSDDNDDQTPLASKHQSAVVSGSSTPQQPSVKPPVRRAPSPPQRASSATPSNSSSARLSPSPASTRSPVSTAGTLNTWSDASLRAWLDGAENDVRDMLVIIHDKSSVVPVTRNHPLMADLFTDESRRLAGLQDELDGLLGNWLARKKSVREVATT
ncbi:hypothetical protein QM012_006486 [Aureobasidium pullulans]|uniref:SH3 domain-containing protein n=1 Tax=Aureobasidium pullulans TaxID=5580 RepID=A0ABR0TNT0_AURPU